MKKINFNKKDLQQMLEESGNICVSVIVPALREVPPGTVGQLELKRAVQKATDQLQTLYDVDEVGLLINSLNEWAHASQFSQSIGGIGYFISAHVEYQIEFPFEVEEKVIVSDHFEIRDLVYLLNDALPYYVLMLSQQQIKLFEGRGGYLQAIHDVHFPKKYVEEYIYEKPSPGTSYGGYSHEKLFERDKTVLEEKRFKDFFGEADDDLQYYLNGHTPLVLVGPVKEIAWFKEKSEHRNRIIDSMQGNYNRYTLDHLVQLVQPRILDYYLNEKTKVLDELEECVGLHRAAFGIHQVWTAVKEGRGLKLLVEKDFRCAGFVGKEGGQLFLKKPELSYHTIPDVVDTLIAMTLQHKGQVVFFDPPMLQEYQSIALITRY